MMSSTLTGLTPTKMLLRLFLFLFPVAVHAQFDQPDRIEIPVSRDEAAFEIIPAYEDGLFLTRKVIEGPSQNLQLIKLDTAFNLSWQGLLPMDRNFELMGKRTVKDRLFLLFRHRELIRKDLELVILDNATGGFVRYDIKNYIPFVPSDFQVTQAGVLVGGYFNNVPVVIFYSFSTNTTKVLPGLVNESGELTQIETDEMGNFDVLIAARNFMNQKTIWVKSYDREANLISQYALQPEGNKHLIFARSVKTRNNMKLVAGTYATSRNSEYSKGIFIASVDPAGYQQIRYYNYGDLKNFFKYMKAKREQRVKERIALRHVRGKKVKFNYRFIVHEIVPYENQFVLLGEAFYPKYITVDRQAGSFFGPFYYGGTGMIRNGRVFDGFRYTHAVVMGFDPNGKLLWDNSFEINDVKTFSLEQFVKLETQQDKIALMYVYNNQLRSKIIKGNEVVEGKTLYPLRTSFSTDVARSEKNSESRLNYWYDRYFYAFGIQEISNAQTGTRRVFFVNKIGYRQSN